MSEVQLSEPLHVIAHLPVAGHAMAPQASVPEQITWQSLVLSQWIAP